MTISFSTRVLLCCSLLSACDSEHAVVGEDRRGNAQAEPDDGLLLQDAIDAGGSEPDANTSAAADGASDAASGVTASGGEQTDGVTDPCDKLTYESTGAPFFAKYCASCHRLPQPTFNNLAEISTMRPRILVRLLQSPKAPMPPPSARIQPTLEERLTLQTWLGCSPLD